MSSSNLALANTAKAEARPVRIIGGVCGPAIANPDALLSGSGVRAWDPEMEAQYWQRVKDKATAMAIEIVAAARDEAVQLRRQAVEEGYAEGQARAQEEFARAFESMSATFGRALDAVQRQGAEIGRAWSADAADLTRMAVEKILNIELESRRTEILANVIDESLETADSLRRLTLVVHPQDADLLDSIMEQAKAVHAGLERWRVRHDPVMTPGGVLLETEHGLVDNRLETRLAAVVQVLGKLGPQQANPDDPTSAVDDADLPAHAE
jgi:flagellar assembly protein FliH